MPKRSTNFDQSGNSSKKMRDADIYVDFNELYMRKEWGAGTDKNQPREIRDDIEISQDTEAAQKIGRYEITNGAENGKGNNWANIFGIIGLNYNKPDLNGVVRIFIPSLSEKIKEARDSPGARGKFSMPLIKFQELDVSAGGNGKGPSGGISEYRAYSDRMDEIKHLHLKDADNFYIFPIDSLKEALNNIHPNSPEIIGHKPVGHGSDKVLKIHFDLKNFMAQNKSWDFLEGIYAGQTNSRQFGL